MISESRSAPSAAPNNVWTSPSGRMIAKAGWVGTSNWANTSPESSLICGNDRSYLSMNPWNWSSVPLQATPTNSACPAHLCAASSTEGASRLQVLHHGAQNHSSTGRPARSPSSISPPPISGAENWRAAGASLDPLVGAFEASDVTAAGSGASVAGVASGSPPPQATSNVAASTGRARRNTEVTVAGCRRIAGSPAAVFRERFRS